MTTKACCIYKLYRISREKVFRWQKEIEALSEIGKSQLVFKTVTNPNSPTSCARLDRLENVVIPFMK